MVPWPSPIPLPLSQMWRKKSTISRKLRYMYLYIFQIRMVTQILQWRKVFCLKTYFAWKNVLTFDLKEIDFFSGEGAPPNPFCAAPTPLSQAP